MKRVYLADSQSDERLAFRLEILAGRFAAGDTIVVEVRDGVIVFGKDAARKKAAAS